MTGRWPVTGVGEGAVSSSGRSGRASMGAPVGPFEYGAGMSPSGAQTREIHADEHDRQ